MADPVSLMLLAGIAATYPAAFGGLALRQWIRSRSHARQRKAWLDFAESRGLVGGAWEADRIWRQRYSGAVRGRHVTLATPAPNDGWVSVCVQIEPPLDLGLRAQAREGSFDPRFSYDLAADEPARGAALFDLPTAAKARRLAGLRWFADDFNVRVYQPMDAPEAHRLDASIGVAIDLVDAIDRAGRKVPPAGWLRNNVPQWKRVAASEGFELGTTPLSMGTVLGDVPVRAFALRLEHDKFGVAAEARFGASLAGAVGLVPTDPGGLVAWLGLDASYLAAEDWLLHDAAFDAAFIVRSRDPSRLAAILPAPLRERLLRLHERAPILLDDFALRLLVPHLLPPDRIPKLLAELAELAAEIAAMVHGSGGATPYR